MPPTPAALYDALPQRAFALPSGRRLHLVDAGPPDGPILVFVHGSPICSAAFRHSLAALSSAGYRVLAPDLPGFGRSSVPPEGADFRDLRDGLAPLLESLPRYTLIAHDWGGPAAVSAAVSSGAERLQGLVLVNTTLRPDFLPPRYWRLSIAPRIGERLVVGTPLVALAMRALMPATASPQVRRLYAGHLQRVGTRRTILKLERLQGFRAILSDVERARGDLRAIPTTLLWGTPDPYFHAPERARLKALFPRARLITLDGGGHFPQEDAAPRFTRTLRWVVDTERALRRSA